MALEDSMKALADSMKALAEANTAQADALNNYVAFCKTNGTQAVNIVGNSSGGAAAPAAAEPEKKAGGRKLKEDKAAPAAPAASDDGLGDDGLGGDEAPAKQYTIDEVKKLLIDVRAKDPAKKDKVFADLGITAFGQLEAKDYNRAAELCLAALK